LGKNLPPEYRRKISEARKGKNLPNPFHKGHTINVGKHRSPKTEFKKGERPYPDSGFKKGNIPQWNKGFRADVGHSVRSSWEANLCRIFRNLGLPYKYEYKQFDLGQTTFTPDFYFPNENFFVELKGRMTKRFMLQLVLMQKFFPDVKLEVIDEGTYKDLAHFWRERINNWEGKP
jgi:hypothetical protein